MEAEAVLEVGCGALLVLGVDLDQRPIQIQDHRRPPRGRCVARPHLGPDLTDAARARATASVSKLSVKVRYNVESEHTSLNSRP